jgi:hypothetical protein
MKYVTLETVNGEEDFVTHPTLHEAASWMKTGDNVSLFRLAGDTWVDFRESTLTLL